MTVRNFHHDKIIEAIRSLDVVDYKAIRKWADELSDEQIIKHMFSSARIDDGEIRGGRLSKYGTELLKKIFDFWEVKLDKPMTARQQLRFSRACRLPYFYTEKRLVSFEKEVGIWLAMIQGDPDLMDNVLPEY